MDILAAIKREEKNSKAARSAFGTGRLCGARSSRREEARFVGCGQSSDCEGGEEALGENKEAGEGGGVGTTQQWSADCGTYCLGLERLVSYIQRRQFSGNMHDLPKKPANIPNRMAVPKTKTVKHPMHSAINVRISRLGYFHYPLRARTDAAA
jgi:hypothetical protein